LHRLRSLDKQRYRRHSPEQIWRHALGDAGDSQRPDSELMLPAEVQRLAARDQELELAPSLQQRSQMPPSAQHLLEVIQDEQYLLVAQVLRQLARGESIAQPKRLGDSRQNKGRFTHGRKVDEDCALGESVEEAPDDRQSQASLADPTPPDQGHEADLGPSEALADGLEFCLTANQRRGGVR
jgi:hypothetical protein